MKSFISKSLLMIGVAAMVLTSCGDKEKEKKVAEAENAFAKSESVQQADPNAAPTTKDDVKPEGPLPVFEFETLDHDFGTINEGDVVKYTYKFKNVGDAPLIIQNAQGSCGCTVPNWPKDPIAPGATGEITAEFNSSGKKELQDKAVTVTANTFPKTTTLRFKAMVTPKK